MGGSQAPMTMASKDKNFGSMLRDEFQSTPSGEVLATPDLVPPRPTLKSEDAVEEEVKSAHGPASARLRYEGKGKS